MKLFKFANQADVEIKDLLALPSGQGLRGSSEISPLIQRKLLKELDQASAPAAPAPKPGPPPASEPPVAAVDRARDASPEQALAVHQVARQLGTFKDDIIDVLRAVTAERTWTADSLLDPAIVSIVRVEFARRRAPDGAVRRAAVARPRASRSRQELAGLRVQSFKPPASAGERALEEVLRGLPTGLALVGVDIATYDKTTDVDAIVVLPSLIATVEVKDTARAGTIAAFLNGPWEVDGQPFQGHGVGPTNQAIQQARILGSARQERPELAKLQRIPATIGVHGPAHFETRPLYEISADCFSFNVEDAVEALDACARRSPARVTVGQVQAMFSWMGVSPSMTFTREELALFGFQEYAA